MLTPNIGVAYSGMGPDSRLLVRRARKQAQVWELAYAPPAPSTTGGVFSRVKQVATIVGLIAQLSRIAWRRLAPTERFLCCILCCRCTCCIYSIKGAPLCRHTTWYIRSTSQWRSCAARLRPSCRSSLVRALHKRPWFLPTCSLLFCHRAHVSERLPNVYADTAQQLLLVELFACSGWNNGKLLVSFSFGRPL